MIEASGMTDVDYTGAQMLETTIGALRSRRIDVALARLSDRQAQQAAARSGILAMLGTDRVFLSVQEAIDAALASGPASAHGTAAVHATTESLPPKW